MGVLYIEGTPSRQSGLLAVGPSLLSTPSCVADVDPEMVDRLLECHEQLRKIDRTFIDVSSTSSPPVTPQFTEDALCYDADLGTAFKRAAILARVDMAHHGSAAASRFSVSASVTASRDWLIQ